MMKHLTIPPKSPSTQSIVAALVWNEHDAGLHRGRWVESMNFIDCVVSCVATILGRVITILDVLPCVLDDMVNARFVCHGHQGLGFDSDGALSAPEFLGPHCLSLEVLVCQEHHLVADRKVASSPDDTDPRWHTLEQPHECNHVCRARRSVI